ncbi:MAG TPA: HAMP domain-containing sensor histidine kinase [Kineosporiaceae bacterium]|nr:HAMP domain-containing sensor histidine kinase [Kineosporiaceae bacterium]
MPSFLRSLRSRAGLAADVPLRLRVRLALSYSVLTIVLGVALLVITYLLIWRSQDRDRADVEAPRVSKVDGVPVLPDGSWAGPTVRIPQPQDPSPDLYQLLILAGIALLIVALFAIPLGWLIAGRVLRPVRMMTATLRQISARNLHERLGITGRRHEIKDLADTIDSLLARLEVALEGHKRFVANAAHELRTPLTVEHALLEEPLIDPDATVESFRSNFQRLLAISEQRGRLLESLITLSESEHGRDRYQALDLGSLIERVLRDRSPEIDRLGLQVDPAISAATILGDPPLIERLVANLLDNAVHHNKPGGWVEIGTRAQGDRLVFYIANSGAVIAPDQVERLVEPFQRLHRVADDGHHGLGLSIVSAIAAAHDATLTVRSRLSGGLFVEVAFPVPTSQPTPSPEAREPHPLSV